MPRFLLIILFALPTLGCSTAPRPAEDEYQTLGKNVGRETERARALNDRAAELINNGNYPDAQKLLKEALAADVMFGPAHNNLGKVYYTQKNLYLAAWEFTYAAKLMKHQPEPRNNLGLVFEASGKLDDAVSEYSEARKLEPENPQFLGNEARARVRRGERGPEVRELLDQIVSLDSRPAWLEWARDQLHLLKASQNWQVPQK
jgi:Tfp pilus assembly protein PilF